MVGGGGNSGILTLASASQSLSNIISGVPYSVQSSNQNSSGGVMGSNSGSSFAVVTNRGGTALQGVIPVATSITSHNNTSNAIVSSVVGGQQQVSEDYYEYVEIHLLPWEMIKLASEHKWLNQQWI